MTLISLPSMIFYWSGSPAQEYSLSTVVPALSLGNIGQSEYACSSSTYDRTSRQVEITLTCPFGSLDAIQNFGQIPKNQQVSCNQAK